jgi:hypothetical protein
MQTTSAPKITRPDEVTDAIREFARELSPQHQPAWVPVQTDPGAEPNDCFNVVPRKVAKDGGEQVNGWTIWEHKNAYLLGEFHAVWKNDGQMTCVSNHPDGETSILFVPEPTRAFLNERVHNRFKPLVNDPVIKRYIFVKNRYMNETKGAVGPVKVSPEKFRRLMDMGGELKALIDAINQKY